MIQQEILQQLETILAKMEANLYSAWDEELKATSDCVMLGDIDHLVYNGWSEDLQALTQKLREYNAQTSLELPSQ